MRARSARETIGKLAGFVQTIDSTLTSRLSIFPSLFFAFTSLP